MLKKTAFIVFTSMFMQFTVANAANWGSFSKYGCYSRGQAKMAAILWNIPWGHDWETACAAQPAYINGYYFAHPKACRNHNGVNMWGEWSVPDNTCE
ncbi:hypothetical protein [Fluviispira multicolorata]|uniref:Uncharacterized protein n=1 Tax=Fluviispira multicolorata TaxID=2654512 RepID=A0A833JBU4_9BACT|nr:hypothetical protein [Fluviispira multicolorata]KAB8029861.1 hypothetical protein GCL57_10000 [Fluviispira multicolorata]